MKIKRILGILFILLLLSVQAAMAEDNLFKNPDIEQVDAHGQPSVWAKDMWYFDGSSELSVSTDAYSGQYSLYIDNMSENDARFVQTVSVEPDTVYAIKCMVRAEDCSAQECGAGLSIKDTFTSTETVHDTNGAWIPLTLYGITGEDQTSVTVMARIGGYGSLNVGRAWFDGFEMIRQSKLPEGAFVYPLFAADTLTPEDEDPESDGQTVSAASINVISIIVSAVYFLLCMGLLMAAFRSKLPMDGDASICKRTFWILCAAALVLRMMLALSVRGFEVDMNCFIGWATRMAESGPSGFYSQDAFCDYPPGYMYILGAWGLIGSVLKIGLNTPVGWLMIKMIPILADIVCAYLVYRTARASLSLGEWVSVLLGVMFAFNPASVINSSIWGQVDGVLTALLLASMLAASHGHYLAAMPIYAAAVLVKPQALLFAPLGLMMLIVEVVESEKKWQTLLHLVGSVALAFFVWIVLSLPFMIHLDQTSLLSETFMSFDIPGFLRPVFWLFRQYGDAIGSETYNYASVNACNLYELLGMNWVNLKNIPSVSVFSWILLGASYAYTLFLYFKAKDRGKVFLCGALFMTLAFALGPKMHERYLYPALGMLLLAYVFDRDIRLMIALIVLSVTQFLNVSLVFGYEYLMNVSPSVFPHALSLANVLCAAFLAWTGWEMCVSGRMTAITRIYKPKSRQAEAARRNPRKDVADRLFKHRDARLNLKRKDWSLMLILTFVYSAIAFINLGTMSAPETQWKSTASGEQITFDLGQMNDFTMTYYGGICSSTFLVQFSEDGQVWSEAHYAQYDDGQMFRWLWYKPCEKDENSEFIPIDSENIGYVQHARYVRLTAERAGLALREVGFLNANGQTLPIASVYSVGGSEIHMFDPKLLVDEQETVQPYPSYLNGMYFDEIYHGRTAYEHLTGEHAYEYTHPPLGKVFIMIGIRLFGMTPFGWRFMGALFGVLMVPLMYLMCKQLFRRTTLSFIGAFLMAVDCMHFTQSRLATVDVFSVFFIMLMYLFMFRYAQMSFYHVKLGRTLVPLGFCGVSMGFAISCKWIGLYGAMGLALIFFYTLFLRWREYRYAKVNMRTFDVDSRRIAQRAAQSFYRNLFLTLGFCLIVFVVVPAFIYYFSYYWHLSPDGQFTLQGVWSKQVEMLNYHRSIGWDVHSFESRWYEWPLIVTPMWYYTGSQYLPGNMVSSISCMGNPVVWWGGALAIIWVMARLIAVSRNDRRYLMIVIGFVTQYAPWIFVTRCTFIYHYFASVPFIILATVAFFEWIRRRSPAGYRVGGTAYCLAALAMFAAFYPLISGFPVLRSYAMYLRWFHWCNF